MDAGVVQRPLRVRPLGALVARVDKERVVLEAVLFQARPHVADALIRCPDVLVVIGERPAGQVRIDEKARQLQPGRVEILVRLPYDVRTAVGHDQAKRRVRFCSRVLRKKSVDGLGIQALHAIDSAPGGVLGQAGFDVLEVEDLFGDGMGLVGEHDAVVETLQVSRQGGDVRPAGRVIAHAAVAGRIQSRVQRGARRGTSATPRTSG